MNRSLGSLPPNVQALLLAERDIPELAEPVRRRATLRARTALWHVRHDVSGRVAPAPRRPGWLRTTIAAVSVAAVSVAAVSIAGVDFAAWVFTGKTESRALRSAPPVLPSDTTMPSTSLSIASAECADPSCAGPTSSAPSPQAPPAARPVPSESASPQLRPPPRSRASTTQDRGRPKPADVELLDAARRAVAAQDYQGALSRLRRHQRLFADSPLSEERDALRVIALEGAGRIHDAKRAARGFDTRHPNSLLQPSLSQPAANAR